MDKKTTDTRDQLISIITLEAQRLMHSLDGDISSMHNQGYGNFATIVSNFRFAVEQAMLKAVDELMAHE